MSQSTVSTKAIAIKAVTVPMIRPTSKTVIARLVIAAAGLVGTAGVSGLLNPALIQKLIELSQELGVKIPLNSGRRNKAYMQSTGQSKSFKPGSQHNIGNAVDVSFRTGLNYNTVNAAATKVGFTGIGKYSTFIHLDVRRPQGSRISRW